MAMSDLHPRAGAVLLGVLVVLVGITAAATSIPATAPITYSTDSGANVTVSFDHTIESSQPFKASDTVKIVNTTVTGANSDITIDSTDGAYLNLSAVDTTSGEITVDGETQPPVTLSGGFSDIDIADVKFDDTTPQIVYSSTADATVNVSSLDPNTRYLVIAGGSAVDGGVTDGNGAASLSLPAATDDSVLLVADPAAPDIDESTASPQNGDARDGPTVDFEVDVDDNDFNSHTDSLDVEFYVDGTLNDTQTITSAQTVTFSETFSIGGSKTWQVEVTDQSGQTVVSDADAATGGDQPFAFNVPAQLSVRDVNNPTSKVTGANATVTFFGSNTVETRADNNGDGTISFNGLPLDERFEATVNADGFERRTVVLPSLFEQRSIYLLNENATIVRPRFTIDSSDTNFPEDDSEIIIERPVVVDGSQQYAAITSKQPGISGFDVALEQDQRYRITVESPAGDSRQLGAFVPTATEQVVLEIQDAGFEVNDDINAVTLNSEWVGQEDGGPAIDVSIGGEDVIASSVNISNRDNGSVLVDEEFSGSASLTEPASDEEQYIVTMTATRELDDGSTEKYNQTQLVSSGQIGTGGVVPERWQIFSSFTMLLVVGGLFTRANAGVGAIVVAGLGGIFWVVGWLPAAASGLTVALALVIGVISYAARQSRGVPT